METERFNPEEFTEVPTMERFLAGEPILSLYSGDLHQYRSANTHCFVTNLGMALNIHNVGSGRSRLFHEFRMRPAKAEPIATLAPEPTKQEELVPNKQASALPNWMRDFQ